MGMFVPKIHHNIHHSFSIHRITEWFRLQGTSDPTPLLKQGHVEQVAQDHVQMAFEYLQGCRLHDGYTTVKLYEPGINHILKKYYLFLTW